MEIQLTPSLLKILQLHFSENEKNRVHDCLNPSICGHDSLIRLRIRRSTKTRHMGAEQSAGRSFSEGVRACACCVPSQETVVVLKSSQDKLPTPTHGHQRTIQEKCSVPVRIAVRPGRRSPSPVSRSHNSGRTESANASRTCRSPSPERAHSPDRARHRTIKH